MNKKSFLNGSNVRLQKALFIEFDHAYETTVALYTLSREDKEYKGAVYPSLYRLYMECDDITEADFVSKYMYDTKQWELISNAPFFRDEIVFWRRDLRLKKLGKAVEFLEQDMLKGDRSSTASAKFLVEKVYGLSSSKRGRPSNAKEIDDGKLFDDQVDEDVKRVLIGSVS